MSHEHENDSCVLVLQVFCLFSFSQSASFLSEGQVYWREPAGSKGEKSPCQSPRIPSPPAAEPRCWGSPAQPGAAFGGASAVISRGRDYSETQGPDIEPNEQHTVVPRAFRGCQLRRGRAGRAVREQSGHGQRLFSRKCGREELRHFRVFTPPAHFPKRCGAAEGPWGAAVPLAAAKVPPR